MPQKVVYRDENRLEQHAQVVLSRYAQKTGWTPSLPVPIEQIIELVYDLTISWEPIDEQPGEKILGMLTPATKTIVMNDVHADGILGAIGPTNFTLAHELGHWLFDADDPNQGELFDIAGEPVFCRGSDVEDQAARNRERNADRFAAVLLLPGGLIDVGELDFLDSSELGHQAREWGVSRQTLEIRIEELSAPERPRY